MTTVVVLGMHRSGTSMMSQMLQAMGVYMGEGLGELQEDMDFVQANRAILQQAGGSWHTPPTSEQLTEAYHQGMSEQICYTLAQKVRTDGRMWGWKDPRTCLTASLWHRHLEDPRYVVIRRDAADVAASLSERHGAAPWAGLCRRYQEFIDAFVESVDAPVFQVRYEDLTNQKAAPLRVQALAEFLGLDKFAAARALDCIEYRDRWGWGSVAVGTPYYRGVYEFFRWWTWMLIDGLEEGDACLNTPDLRCEVPIPLAHNGLMQEFLKTPCDTLCIIEDDHVGPQDQIRRMRTKVENQAFDIVCASYTNRRDNAYMAIGVDLLDDDVTEYGEINCHLAPLEVWKTGTQPYDAAALGCVFIRRWVIEAMLGDNDPTEYFWFDWRGRNSQDVVFYRRVKEMTGARVGVDRDNAIGHVGKKVFTMTDFHNFWEPHIERTRRKELPWGRRALEALREAKGKFLEVMDNG